MSEMGRSVVLAVGRLLPVFFRKRTSSAPVGMFQKCHERSSELRQRTSARL